MLLFAHLQIIGLERTTRLVNGNAQEHVKLPHIESDLLSFKVIMVCSDW